MKTYTTLERVYSNMMGALPVAAMETGAHGVEGFLEGEPTDHFGRPSTCEKCGFDGMAKNKLPVCTGCGKIYSEPRYAAYFRADDEYFTGGPLSVAEFREAVNKTEQELRDDEETPEEIAEELRLIEEYSADAVNAYHALGFEKNNGLDGFEEAYAGEWPSDEDFAQNMAEECGEIDKEARWPYTCIDWEQAARELMYDYAEENGHYFRNC